MRGAQSELIAQDATNIRTGWMIRLKLRLERDKKGPRGILGGK